MATSETGGYSVDKVRYRKGHDGMVGVDCRLLRDGQPVAEVYDGEMGGGPEFRFLKRAARATKGRGLQEVTQAEATRVEGEEARFYDFVKALPPEPSPSGKKALLPVSDEQFLGRLVSLYEAGPGLTEWMKRQCATKTLFVEAGTEVARGTRFRTIERTYGPEVKAHLEAKYPGCIIINERFPQTPGQRALGEAGIKRGDTVEWSNGKTTMRGVVLRLNQKTVSVVGPDGREWRLGIGGSFRKVTP